MPAPPSKNKFGQPEKPDTAKNALLWGLVILGLAAIVWMIATNAPEKRLNCAGGPSSLTGFGSCTAE